MQAFSSPFAEQTTGLLKRQNLAAPPAQGGTRYFSVAFAPVISQVFGSSAPPAKLVLHVRVVMADGAGKPLSPASDSVRVTYNPPAAGTKLESSMTLRLKQVRCIRQTDGPGEDDIVVEVLRAPMITKRPAESLFYHAEENIGENWKVEPGTIIETYAGIGFKPRSHIAVAVAEDDAGITYPTTSIVSSGVLEGNFLNDYTKQWCVIWSSLQTCIGSPQLLTVTQADWNKVALGGQTITKLLRFAGEGALYEVTFELSPK